MPKAKNPSRKAVASAPKAGPDVLSLPLADLRKRAARAQQLIAQASALLPGLLELTSEARKHSVGRYRKGEADALLSVLDLADAKPALFESLADKDKGDDPQKFETDLLRDRLSRAAALAPIIDELDGLSEGISDTALFLSEQTKPVMLAAYEIAKPQAKHSSKIRSTVAPALNFYGKIAQTGLATRRKGKKP